MEKLVVDAGFGFTKYLYGDQKGKFRTCLKREGDGWLVGDDALYHPGVISIRTVEELIRYYPILVKESQKRAGAESVERVIVGLPGGDAVEDEELVDSLVAKLEKAGYQDVTVMPQGLGGIRYFLSKHPVPSGNVLGVDVGFNTIILTLYSLDEGRILLTKTFHKKGVLELATAYLYPKIKYLIKRNLTYQELAYILENRGFQVALDFIDLSSEVEEATREYVEELFSFVVETLRGEFGTRVSFRHLLFFGGGAYFLKNAIEGGKTVHVHFLDEPEFANVKGFSIAAEDF